MLVLYHTDGKLNGLGEKMQHQAEKELCTGPQGDGPSTQSHQHKHPMAEAGQMSGGEAVG